MPVPRSRREGACASQLATPTRLSDDPRLAPRVHSSRRVPRFRQRRTDPERETNRRFVSRRPPRRFFFSAFFPDVSTNCRAGGLTRALAPPESNRHPHVLDAGLVQNLRDVVERTDARVVLCGDGNDDEGLRTRATKTLKSRGVFVFGWTDASGKTNGRAEEIVRWLEREEERLKRNASRDDVAEDPAEGQRGLHGWMTGDMRGGSNAVTTRRRTPSGETSKIVFAAADETPLVAQPFGDALVGRFVMTAPGAGLTAAAADAIVACLMHQSHLASAAHDASSAFRALEKTAEPARFGGCFGGVGRFADASRPDSSDSSRSSSSSSDAFDALSERIPAGFVSFRTSRSRTSLATTMTHRQSNYAEDVFCSSKTPRMSVEGTTATFSPPRLSRRARDSARDATFALGEGARFIAGGDRGKDYEASVLGSSWADAEETMHVVRYD